MSKYIIEIAEEYEEYFKGVLICGIADGKFAVDVIAREDLEELNSDYINENFGKLQDEAYQKGINDGSLDVKQRVEGAYQRGLEDAWEAARKIIHMPEGDLLNIFTECYSAVCTALQVLLKYDASEAIAKLKAYEDKQKDRIEVWDEVEAAFGTAVVTYCEEESVGYLYSTGSTGFDEPRNVKKTGRHFDIASILEAMRQ